MSNELRMFLHFDKLVKKKKNSAKTSSDSNNEIFTSGPLQKIFTDLHLEDEVKKHGESFPGSNNGPQSWNW